MEASGTLWPVLPHNKSIPYSSISHIQRPHPHIEVIAAFDLQVDKVNFINRTQRSIPSSLGCASQACDTNSSTQKPIPSSSPSQSFHMRCPSAQTRRCPIVQNNGSQIGREREYGKAMSILIAHPASPLESREGCCWLLSLSDGEFGELMHLETAATALRTWKNRVPT